MVSRMKKSIREDLVDYWGDEELLFLDPAEDFDRAIVGVAERIGMDSVVVYDKELILKMLCKEMPSSQAVEYFEFNVLGSYVGEKTPVFLTFTEKLKSAITEVHLIKNNGVESS